MISEKVFVDTSAFYALMDRSDGLHNEAARLWAFFLEEDIHFLTTNYVMLETAALLQGRLGFEAANLWYRDVLSVVDILWIGASEHNLAFELWLTLGRRRLSLVDCVSFISMRHHRLQKVFGFDKHFAEQGFEIMRK
jgi:predicted nucleic acid-binding protein